MSDLVYDSNDINFICICFANLHECSIKDSAGKWMKWSVAYIVMMLYIIVLSLRDGGCFSILFFSFPFSQVISLTLKSVLIKLLSY